MCCHVPPDPLTAATVTQEEERRGAELRRGAGGSAAPPTGLGPIRGPVYMLVWAKPLSTEICWGHTKGFADRPLRGCEALAVSVCAGGFQMQPDPEEVGETNPLREPCRDAASSPCNSGRCARPGHPHSTTPSARQTPAGPADPQPDQSQDGHTPAPAGRWGTRVATWEKLRWRAESARAECGFWRSLTETGRRRGVCPAREKLPAPLTAPTCPRQNSRQRPQPGRGTWALCGASKSHTQPF